MIPSVTTAHAPLTFKPTWAQPLRGTRATLLRRSQRHVAEAKRELLDIVNGPLMQRYIPGPAVDLLNLKGDHPLVQLASGYEHSLLPLLPPQYHARYSLARSLPLKAPMVTTGLALTFTAFAAGWMGPIAISIGVYFSVTEAWGLYRLARDKAHMNDVDNAATRVNDLLDNIRDWSRRAEDAMDTRGANLQQIYEERRDRSSTPGLLAGMQPPMF